MLHFVFRLFRCRHMRRQHRLRPPLRVRRQPPRRQRRLRRPQPCLHSCPFPPSSNNLQMSQRSRMLSGSPLRSTISSSPPSVATTFEPMPMQSTVIDFVRYACHAAKQSDIYFKSRRTLCHRRRTTGQPAMGAEVDIFAPRLFKQLSDGPSHRLRVTPELASDCSPAQLPRREMGLSTLTAGRSGLRDKLVARHTRRLTRIARSRQTRGITPCQCGHARGPDRGCARRQPRPAG
jgi:hypothetical protein